MTDEQIIRQQASDEVDFGSELHPVLKRVFNHRGVRSTQEVSYKLSSLLPPVSLKETEAAAVLLQQALEAEWRILIVADFDADGATSCALALRALRALGANQTDYLVPNRFNDGYGLSPKIVESARRRDADLIITVDNGISSIEGVKLAKQYNMKVLVTDHHLPGEQLPAADVMVNPNNPGDNFASKHLAGVGVIFYVMMALRAKLRTAGWFQRKGIEEPNLASLLDLVALGTVADVVPLDYNNRILVQQGLQRIRAGRCCPGISALLSIAGRVQKCLVASDLGFAVGPRLNAAGRLEDMSQGIECLLTDSAETANRLACSLDSLNKQRREIEADMKSQAMEHLAKLELGEQLPYGLVLFDESWHQGVVGILAARIKERYNRPVIAFSRSEQGELKGSARSIGGLHMRDALAGVATSNPGLIEKFGGHAMAAGLTLEASALERFSRAFDHEVRSRLSPHELEPTILSDGSLSNDELSLEVAQLIENAGPWGQGFSEPLFDDTFQVLDHRVVGQLHLKLRLNLIGHSKPLEAIAFNLSTLLPELALGTRKIHATYHLGINRYKGQQQLQLIIHNFRIY